MYTVYVQYTVGKKTAAKSFTGAMNTNILYNALTVHNIYKDIVDLKFLYCKETVP